MTTIDRQMTLSDLVTTRPGLARELEKLELDYCCHGNRSLADATAAAGLELDEVVAALECVDAPVEDAAWVDLELGELAKHVCDKHHSYLWDELPRLSMLTEKIAEVHGAHHPELEEVATVYAAMRVAFEPHMRREEIRVFPAIGRVETRPDDELPALIERLVDEHEAVAVLLEKLRHLTDGYTVPADGCNAYRMTMEGLAQLERDTFEHVHKENNVLFPRALAAVPSAV